MYPHLEPVAPRMTYADRGFHMTRHELTANPPYACPSGYTLRSDRSGDAAARSYLHCAAEPFFDTDHDLFFPAYGKNLEVRPEGMGFTRDRAGNVVASINTWWEKDPTGPADRARVHRGVVHPDVRSCTIR